jgi:hypothetical protein
VVFVKAYEVTERNWKSQFLISVKGIESKRILKPGNDQCKAEGIQAGIQELQFIGETREFPFLLYCNLFELGADSSPERHVGSLMIAEILRMRFYTMARIVTNAPICMSILHNSSISTRDSVTLSFAERSWLDWRGFTVRRFALRGWSEETADPVERQELAKTHYVPRRGPAALVPPILHTCRRVASSERPASSRPVIT